MIFFIMVVNYVIISVMVLGIVFSYYFQLTYRFSISSKPLHSPFLFIRFNTDQHPFVKTLESVSMLVMIS